MDGGDTSSQHHHPFQFSPLLIGLIGIIAGAVMVATYQCIAIGCNYHRRGLVLDPTPFQLQQGRQPERNRPIRPNTSTITARTRTSTRSGSVSVRLPVMPVFTYSKGCREGTCAVCLCEFSEGEEIRTLPQCMHSFHAPCVDMWLYSHANCPLCRTDTSPPPQPPQTRQPEAHLELEMPSSDGVPAAELPRLSEVEV